MGELDFAAKVVLREDPGALLGLVCPDRRLVPVRMAPTEVVRAHQFKDSLVEVTDDALGHGYVHIEFAATWRADIPDRELEYYALARNDHRPLIPAVVCMSTTRSRPPRRTWSRSSTESGTKSACGSSSASCASGSCPPLVPFASNALETTVEEAMRVLDQVDADSRRVELQVALGMLAGNVFPGREWLGRIPKEILMTSTTYQQLRLEIERDVRLEAKRSSVATLLRARCPSRAESLVSRLPVASEDIVDRVLRLIGTIRVDDDLIGALDAILPR